jgi:6-phosphogluconolactonase
LLQDLAAKAQLVHMVTGITAPLENPAVQAQAAGLALQATGVADVLILGMGADGHTASLFPEAPNLSEALDLRNTQVCVAIELAHPPVQAPYPRVTQTLAQILSSRHIVLPVSGADKLHTLQRAWSQVTPALPISFVLQQQQTPVALWLTH